MFKNSCNDCFVELEGSYFVEYFDLVAELKQMVEETHGNRKTGKPVRKYSFFIKLTVH